MLTAIEIGNKIEQSRKSKGLSQTQLASMLSVTSQAVGKWERGESMPDIIMFERIAKALDTDLNYFSESFNTKSNSYKTVHEAIATGEQVKKPGWNMSGGNWANADFSGLKNLGEKFSGANINNCLFIGSDLSKLKLRGNNMAKNDFSKTNFSGSQFKGAHILNNIFADCSFNETLFSGNHIHDCDFSNADLTGAIFKFSNIQKNKMQNAKWNRTSFSGSNLTDIVFEGTISDCSFINCGFARVTFQNAILTNTFFKCRTKKIKFTNCKADSLSYAFLKNGKSDMTGISLV